MKAFDPNYKLLDEMYQDDYYPAFLVDKVKDELQKVIALLESGETGQQAFILDLSFNPEITDELMVVYFDLNKEIFCITHES